MLTLEAITSSAGFPPQKILIYGPHGLGKTTFGCTFAAPVLLRTEDGASALDVPTFPLARTCRDVADALTALHGEHAYRTLVLDSLDWLEPLVLAQTCARLRVESIERMDYGKGYVEADAEWNTIMAGLDSLRWKRGMDVVLIAHSELRTFTPPDAPAWDRYQIKLHKRAWARWQEWADMVLFCAYERRLTQDRGKVCAEGAGERVIHTEERPAWLAKNRWSLPPAIHIGGDRSWSAFHTALATASGGRYRPPSAASARPDEAGNLHPAERTCA